ncbi:MAG: HEAT repeat domain-containing protein, partial [Planctomycetota bacterium]
PDWQVAVEALLALREFGAGGNRAELCLEALSREDAAVRLAGLQALAVVGGPGDGARLLRSLGKESRPRLVATGLLAMAERRMQAQGAALAPFFGMDDPQVRAAAVHAAGRLALDTAVPRVGPLLRDDAALVRRAAATAWAALRGQEGAPELERLCGDDDSTVREAAAGALAEAGRVESLDPLGQLQADPYRQVRRAASEAMLRLAGQDDAVRAEVERLALANVASDAHVRRLEGLVVLGRLGGTPAAEQALAALEGVEGMPEARLSIWMIGRCKVTSAAERVVAAITDDAPGPDGEPRNDTAMRLHGAVAVGRLRHAPAVPHIDKVLSETKTEMGVIFYVYGGLARTELMRSLTEIDTDAAAAALRKRATATRPFEAIDNLQLALRYLKDRGEIPDLVGALKKLHGTKEISDDHKRLIVDVLVDATGSAQGLERPEQQPSYDHFFLQAR